jgi:amino-acid N-acetyltransferase
MAAWLGPPLLRPATPADRPALERLLASARLPLDGLADTRLFVLEEGDAIVGAVGFERHGDLGLLRSLAVDPGHRGAGLGAFLLESGLLELRRAGVREAYGLTETIASWLERLGWEELARDDLPAALRASRELQGACPDSARAFRLRLAA